MLKFQKHFMKMSQVGDAVMNMLSWDVITGKVELGKCWSAILNVDIYCVYKV